MAGRGWTAVVPVEAPDLGDFCLELPEDHRRRLMRAFASDVLAALSESRLVDQIVVVGSRHEIGRDARRVGAVLLTDRPLLSMEGLNDAVGMARRWAVARRPGDPLLVVPADLPCMTTASFDEAVSQMAEYETAFVPDVAGTGTTLLTARTPTALRPSFGAASASRHAQDGAAPVLADRRARQDVDTVQDLREARHLGVGCHTRTVLSTLGL